MRRGVAQRSLLLLSMLPFLLGFLFETPTDKLELNESLGGVVEAVTAANVPLLASGEIALKDSQMTYEQVFRFSDANLSLASPRAVYEEDDNGDLGDYLKLTEGEAVTDAFMEYEIRFQEGMKVTVSDGAIPELVDKKIALLGELFTILKVKADLSRNSLTMELVRSAATDTLDEGATKAYTVDGKSYDIEIFSIQDTRPAEVVFRVGTSQRNIKEGEIGYFNEGIAIAVSKVTLQTGNGTIKDQVTFHVGAETITFTDSDDLDDQFTRGIQVNGANIVDGYVKFKAQELGAADLRVDTLKYRIVPRARGGGDIYLKKDEVLSKKLAEPKVLLTKRWDLVYRGLARQDMTTIRLDPETRDKYNLVFTNRKDQAYKMPFVSNGGNFKLGDATRSLFFIEPSSKTDFQINQDQYMVMTSANDKTGITSILRYSSIDPTNQILFFDDLVGGETLAPYSVSTLTGILGEGNVVVQGKNYQFYIKNQTGGTEAYAISVDLTGDGSINSGEAKVVTKNGAMIDLGSTNTPATSFDITLTTPLSQFDEGSSDETLTISLERRNNDVGISQVTGGLNGVQSHGADAVTMSRYGVLVQLEDSGTTEELTITYPAAQLLPSVELVNLATGEIIIPTCSDSLQNQGETAVDCGGPCGPCVVEEAPQVNETIALPEVTETPTAPVCNGCLADDICYALGSRVATQYCSSDSEWKFQKEKGEACAENYQCVSNVCSEGVCNVLQEVNTAVVVTNALLLIAALGYLRYLKKL